MKENNYVILYSILVNGEEYNREKKMKGTSKNDAESKLKKLLNQNDGTQFTINQVIPI